jgi:ERCC4-type nuclease
MIYAARQLRRQARGCISGKGRRPKNRRKRQLRVLQSLPGIGPERAELLLARLGSVQAVMDADPELLQTVDGIGETTAAAIRSVLQEKG